MIHKTYGQTGISMSAIGFGGMRFTDQNNVDQCASLVKYAYDHGINYFDTAPGYGKSEDLFGVAFKEMKKTRTARPFYVSTKTFASDAAAARRDLETSLKRMGLDHIDFYHVWCIMSHDSFSQRKAGGVLKEFEKMKAEGLIKHICVSSHMTGAEIGKMLADYPFEGVLLGYSAMNFAYRDKGLDAAAKLGRGLVVMNPLGGGIIPREPARFAFVRTQKNETAVEGALRFLINDKRITISLVGFSSTAQVDEALRAVDGFKPLTAKQVDKIRGGLKEAFNELCTGCRYCDECPEGIPVPRYMEAYNHMLLGKGPQDMINRLKWHWEIRLEDDYLERCTKCRHCEENCTQKLPICERLDKIKAEVKKALAAKKKQ